MLAAARRTGALVTVHCENYEAIGWRTGRADGGRAQRAEIPRLVAPEGGGARGDATAPSRWPSWWTSRSRCSTSPAPEVAEEIARAQARGVKVWAETCPQYFVLQAADMDRPGFEGAKFMCSPSPRGRDDAALLWERCAARHARRDLLRPLRAPATRAMQGKRRAGTDAPFPAIPNGVPGLASRLPLVFSAKASAAGGSTSTTSSA